MVLKIFDHRLTTKTQQDASQRSSTSFTPQPPDPKLLEKIAALQRADKKGVDDARLSLSEAYQSFLAQLNNLYAEKAAAQIAKTGAFYEAWAAYFELIKKNFLDAWNFLGVIQADVNGWFRVAPAGKEVGFLSVNSEGYSFAAGVEQNTARGAPYPKKWMTVSLAFHSSHAVGIGDERLIGRLDHPDSDLIGFARCTGKTGDAKEEGARQLYARIAKHPLVFTLFTEKHGQQMTEVHVSVLEKHSLSELCQPLLVALTNDDIKGAPQLLPKAERLLLK